MKKAISVMQKRGRPATGKMPTIALRAPDDFRIAVEKWAAKQNDKPSLSEAIRRLVELGLVASKTKTSKLVDQHVVSKASQIIDSMSSDLKAGLKAKGKP